MARSCCLPFLEPQRDHLKMALQKEGWRDRKNSLLGITESLYRAQPHPAPALDLGSVMNL